ncbi:MAG: glycogen/starch synthase [Balneolaceae bacterium]
MRILHISAECYPAAKAGGLGDVAGALPKYLNRIGHDASVVIPKYETPWIMDQETETVFEGRAPYGSGEFGFRVERVKGAELGFDLFLIHIPGRFDREGIYIDPWSGHPYWDEMDRFFSFQIAALEWVVHLDEVPDMIHTHDHHTGLVPFLMSHCFRFNKLRNVPAVLTIHNGEYQGRYAHGNYLRLPAFNLDEIGLLEWDEQLNSLAAGIKCAWRVTTVSEGYLGELMENCHGLETLLRSEKQKTLGLINGIDTEVWDPASDPFLEKNYTSRSRKSGKKANKKFLCDEFRLDPDRPMISFIGRLVMEKGADLLPDIIRRVREVEAEVNILILGTGDPALHEELTKLKEGFIGYFNTRLEYNEALAHKIYAGSDFLLMPSRVEPCGLNQMYAMRYGTLPIVRATGGLADTVIDLSDENGYGLTFNSLTVDEVMESIYRGIDLYKKEKFFSDNQKRIMNLDFSWDQAARDYEKMYKELLQEV